MIVEVDNVEIEPPFWTQGVSRQGLWSVASGRAKDQPHRITFRLQADAAKKLLAELLQRYPIPHEVNPNDIIGVDYVR